MFDIPAQQEREIAARCVSGLTANGALTPVYK
jgi:hypothetical protein